MRSFSHHDYFRECRGITPKFKHLSLRKGLITNRKGLKSLKKLLYLTRERCVKCKFHAQCGVGEKLQIISKVYLSLSCGNTWDASVFRNNWA